MTEKKLKHVCECTNCGNESEMVVTCTLADENTEEVVPKVVPKKKGKTQGHAVCAHCGGEADIWLDVLSVEGHNMILLYRENRDN